METETVESKSVKATKEVALIAVLSAAYAAAIMLVIVPSPTGGYTQIGDFVVFVAASLFGYRVGDRAPDFSLPSNAGDFTLSQFFGKKNVVLFFYPMDESPVCSREAEAFRDKYEVFKELDAVVIGISSQSVESHKSFASHHSLPFILLSDSGNTVRKLYGVFATLGIVPGRVTYVINKEGIIKHVFSSQLQPAKHADDALHALGKTF